MSTAVAPLRYNPLHWRLLLAWIPPELRARLRMQCRLELSRREACAARSAAKRRRRARRDASACRPRPTVCEICAEPGHRIVFDHNHATGAFRGWLCDRCNRMLGQVKDSTALLERMIGYLTADRSAPA